MLRKFRKESVKLIHSVDSLPKVLSYKKQTTLRSKSFTKTTLNWKGSNIKIITESVIHEIFTCFRKV